MIFWREETVINQFVGNWSDNVIELIREIPRINK